MNAKSFFVAALSSALDLGLASCDDVVRHVTPDVLAAHLPRPLWARLLTVCISAPHVNAKLVVDTIGIANLCEHIPMPILWTCIAEVAARSLGGVVTAIPTMPSSRPIVTRTGSHPVATGSRPVPLMAQPPKANPPISSTSTPPLGIVGPSIPSPGTARAVSDEFEAEDKSHRPGRARTPSQRLRQTNTNIGRLAANQRRPQAQAAAPSPVAPPADFELDDDSDSKDDWKNVLAVEDEQLVDWSPSEEPLTAVTDSRDNRLGRKR